ncbi:MAG: HicB like antitoxin of bacterial toxin-antitoxin system [Thermoplasmata archaeon]|jgi:predicted RNase H-like HicB family nuclease|nr:HicB like antitoxin of bacterial toxin-antitoxin system [Thermoplasmata archaeon]
MALHDFHSVAPSFAVRIDRGEDGLYYAACLDLQGCHTFGATRAQAIERIKEVILDHLQSRLAAHAVPSTDPLPEGSELVEIST